MINLDRAIWEEAPFPMIRIDDCLEKTIFEGLSTDFPSEAETSTFETLHGGRRRLSSDEAAFYQFLSGRPSWRSFYNYMNCAAFVEDVLKTFQSDIQGAGSPLSEPIRFDQNCLYRRVETQGRSSWRKALKRQIRRAKTICEGNTERVEKRHVGAGENECYLHLDVSAGHDGYTREIHRDLDNRLAAFLLYFSDADETGGQGGEFCIHKLVGELRKEDFVRQPALESTVEVKRIKPKRNRFLMFLSTPNSYHSVPRIVGSNAPRKFIYGAITAKRDLCWPDMYYDSTFRKGRD